MAGAARYLAPLASEIGFTRFRTTIELAEVGNIRLRLRGRIRTPKAFGFLSERSALAPSVGEARSGERGPSARVEFNETAPPPPPPPAFGGKGEPAPGRDRIHPREPPIFPPPRPSL